MKKYKKCRFCSVVFVDIDEGWNHVRTFHEKLCFEELDMAL